MRLHFFPHYIVVFVRFLVLDSTIQNWFFWSCVLDSIMVPETYLSTLLSSTLPLSYLNTQFYKQFKLSSTPTVEETLKNAYGQDSTCRDCSVDVKKETTGPKTLKTEAFVNAWTHKMWHGDSAATIFSIRFVLREFMWHLEKENISGLSLHIVSERGQLPDWGGARGWRHALCRWHPVHSCHLPPDSTSAVPPCFPGLARSTKLLACCSP